MLGYLGIARFSLNIALKQYNSTIVDLNWEVPKKIQI